MYVKRVILYIIMVMLAGVVAAQDEKVDALLQRYDAANESSRRIIAKEFFEELRALEFVDKMPKIDFNSHSLDTLNMLVNYWGGEWLYERQEYDEAIRRAEFALPMCNTDEVRSDCQSLLSILYFRKSNYELSLKYAQQSLETDKRMGDKTRISTALNTIAGIYLAAKQPREGERFILEAISNSTAAGDSSRMVIQCGMASEIYHSMGNDVKALDYARRAFEIDSLMGHTNKLGIRLSQMATAQIAMENYSAAESSLRRAIPILKASPQVTSLGISYNQMGHVLNITGRHQQAANYYGDALKIFQEKKDIYNESKSRYGLYESLRNSNPSEALVHLQKYTELKDSLYQRDLERSLSQYSAKYQNEELQMQNDREKEKSRMILLIGLLLVAMLLLLIAVMLYIYSLRKKRNQLQKELLDTKERFYTNFTHEFRTPLTIIHSAAQDILRKAKPDCDVADDAVTIIRHQTGLLSLINQILSITKLTSGATIISQEWKHGDIVGYITMICQSMQTYAADRRLTIEMSNKDAEVDMDFIPEYILRIVQNLLSNAIKFSPEDSTIIVFTKRVEGRLQLYVSDQGSGMNADQKANIFKPFYQAPSDSMHIGTGIGLSLVKLSVEALGGSIDLHSAPGHGTTFIIDLPIRAEHTDKPFNGNFSIDSALLYEDPNDNLPDDEVSEADEVRILIVEDTHDVAKYIRKQLPEGFSYYFADNGEDGLKKAEELVPDLIITDIMMPGINGYELCRRVRGSELLNHIPVVMVTAKVTHDDRIRGLEVGADAYLEKPFHGDELALRVMKLLEQREMLRRKWSVAVDEGKSPELDCLSETDAPFLTKLTDCVNGLMQGGKVDFKELSYAMCLSRAQLNRKVKAITGLTTTEFVLNIRISVAKQLLDTTKMPIYEVSMACGIDNVTYFNTIFKKSVGMTPLQYRDRNKSAEAKMAES